MSSVDNYLGEKMINSRLRKNSFPISHHRAMYYAKVIPSVKLTARPWKPIIGRWNFLLKIAYFQVTILPFLGLIFRFSMLKLQGRDEHKDNIPTLTSSSHKQRQLSTTFHHLHRHGFGKEFVEEGESCTGWRASGAEAPISWREEWWIKKHWTEESKTLPTDLRSISLDDYEGNLHLWQVGYAPKVCW